MGIDFEFSGTTGTAATGQEPLGLRRRSVRLAPERERSSSGYRTRRICNAFMAITERAPGLVGLCGDRIPNRSILTRGRGCGAGHAAAQVTVRGGGKIKEYRLAATCSSDSAAHETGISRRVLIVATRRAGRRRSGDRR